MTADRTDEEESETEPEADRKTTTDDEPDTTDDEIEEETTTGEKEDEESDDEYGVTHEDAPDSVEEISRPGGEGEQTEFPALTEIDEPHRTTAPQSRFESRAVTIGLLVLLVGLLIAFGVPLFVAG